ncbi:flagellar basal body rod protein FlgB [Methylocapsa acidiphila]|uniref:flagellar basal body rod protein FlgB n=1 Tax=Methylocapsa acidiphila TaxID=133552 RepID=UPI000412F317|nr:flagellar basal body rod protein FlgB [Methylocapsa acidiphila]
MDSIYLLSLASQQARWLSARQVTIAENVSNANTPGYVGRDVAPFDEVLNNSALRMSATHSAHLGVDALAPDVIANKESDAWEVTHSGNSVSLEQEMIKAADVNRNYSLNMSIVKAFNQMLMASVKV